MHWCVWVSLRMLGSRVTLFIACFLIVGALMNPRSPTIDAVFGLGIMLLPVWRVAGYLYPRLKPRRLPRPARALSVPIVQPLAFAGKPLTYAQMYDGLSPQLKHLIERPEPDKPVT